MLPSLRRIWPYLRIYRADITLIFIFGLALTVVSGLIPLLAQLFFSFMDRSTPVMLMKHLPTSVQTHFPVNDANINRVAFWLPVMFPVVYFLNGLLKYLHYMLLTYASEKTIALVRLDLLRKIVRLNLTYHGSLQRGTGVLISRVFNDTLILKQGLSFYADLIREPIQAMIYLAYMFFEDWRLSAFSLLFLPAFLIITKKLSRSLRKYGIRGRDAMEDLTSVVKETVDGVRVIQSFNLEKKMEDRFNSHQVNYLNTARKVAIYESAASPMNEFVVSMLVMCFAYYTLSQVLYHGVDGAKFMGFLFAAGLMQMPVKRLQDANVKIQQNIIVTERIFEILESQSEVPEAKDAKAFPPDWQKIEFRGVSFSYGGENVLKDINLTVRRGEVIALVGESGSGKSTLVNLLERFYDPTGGQILIDDVSISDIRLKDLRAHIALVTQDVFLFRDSIEHNIQAGDFSKDVLGVPEAAKMANAANFISSTGLGYQNPVGERGSFLSGGEKQRVSIARAIFKDAPILILDEATSALDSVSEKEVQKGLTQLMKGRTAFVIAHRLSTVFSADRILVMKKGEIVEQGNHASLIARQGEYHNFFQLQVNHDERGKTAVLID
jgi:subfamily B ATP-binding cassette protein MsbA